MNKFIKIIIIAFIISISSVNNSQAQLKVDAGRLFNEIKDTFSEYSKKAQEKVDEVLGDKQGNLLGNGNEARESLGVISKKRDEIKKGKKRKSEEPKEVEYDDVRGSQDEEPDAGYDEIEETTDEEVATSNTYKMLELQNQKKTIASETDNLIKAEELRLNGELAKIDNNTKVYEEQLKAAKNDKEKEDLNKKISTAPEMKQSLTDVFEQNKQKHLQEQEQKLAEIEAKIKELNEKDEAEKKSNIKEKVTSIFDREEPDTEALFAEVGNQLFIPEDKPETSSAVKQVRDFRASEAATVNKNVFARALEIKSELDAHNEIVESIAETTRAQEGSNSSVAIGENLEIEEMQAVLNNIELILLDLKQASINDLAKIPEYKRKNIGNSELQVLNFCDYIYNKDDFKASFDGGSSADSINETIGGMR